MAASYSTQDPSCHDAITRYAPETPSPSHLAHRRRGDRLDAHGHRPGRRALAAVAASTSTAATRLAAREGRSAVARAVVWAGESYVIVRAQNADAVGVV